MQIIEMGMDFWEMKVIMEQGGEEKKEILSFTPIYFIWKQLDWEDYLKILQYAFKNVCFLSVCFLWVLVM